MSLLVRPATAEDIPAVTALEQQVFAADAWSTGSVREELTGARRCAVVAVHDGVVVGYAVTADAGDAVDLQRIAVRPEDRRTGAGRALLDAVLEPARAAGVERVLLEVSAANQVALAFYARAGFAEIDRRPRYYRDGSDALVLRGTPAGAGRAVGADPVSGRRERG